MGFLPHKKKTYSLIVKAIGCFFPRKILDTDSFLKQLKWLDGSSFLDISTKQIYMMLKYDYSIFTRVNQCWGLDWPKSRWQFVFYFFWHSPIDPNKYYFRWFLLLKKLAVGSFLSVVGAKPIRFVVCSVQESF